MDASIFSVRVVRGTGHLTSEIIMYIFLTFYSKAYRRILGSFWTLLGQWQLEETRTRRLPATLRAWLFWHVGTMFRHHNVLMLEVSWVHRRLNYVHVPRLCEDRSGQVAHSRVDLPKARVSRVGRQEGWDSVTVSCWKASCVPIVPEVCRLFPSGELKHARHPNHRQQRDQWMTIPC